MHRTIISLFVAFVIIVIPALAQDRKDTPKSAASPKVQDKQQTPTDKAKTTPRYQRAVFVYWSSKDDNNESNKLGYDLNRISLKSLHQLLHKGECEINQLGKCQFVDTPSVNVVKQPSGIEIFLGSVGGGDNLAYLFHQDVIIKIEWFPDVGNESISAAEAIRLTGSVDEAKIKEAIGKYLAANSVPPERGAEDPKPKTKFTIVATAASKSDEKPTAKKKDK